MAHLKSAKFPVVVVAVVFGLLFGVAGLAFLPYPGIQNDEAIFASSLYPPHAATYSLGPVPLMFFDYAGCLKTWIYAPLFAVFPPSPWSLRVPVILLGALSVFLFTLLLYSAGGKTAACIGGALLVTDPVFALTNNFDWGPVAFQHFLLITGLLALTRFHRTAAVPWLALAAFSFGLALWDKALFIWLLLPICIAGLLIWPKAVRRHLTLRNTLAALASFLLGAAPLLLFNATHAWVTFRSHTIFSAAELPAKLHVLRATVNGSVLFGYLVRGQSKTDLLEYGVLVALAALPFIWRTEVRKAAVFTLFVLVAAWAQMAFNCDTGGGAHHIILLWPFPQFLIALVFSRFRRLGPVACLILVAANLGVFQRYWHNLITEGPAIVWSDAIGPLSQDSALTGANPICLLDWGLTDPLQILFKGTLPLRDPDSSYLKIPEALWVSHVTGQEFSRGLNTKLEAEATSQGLRKVPVKTYNDRHGNPIFETFRFTSR